MLDFVVIGASKSGTTSLFQYLRTHPEIGIPPGKDAPFFARRARSSEAWELFLATEFNALSERARWGTVTPRYMEHSEMPSRIAERLPNVRLVATLRNPVDRALSQFRQQARQAKEDRTFEAAMSELMDESAANAARRLDPPALETEASYLVHGEYGRILDGYLEWFDREQLLVVFTEDLERDPVGTVQSVFRHIGVDPSVMPDNVGRRYHQGGTSRRFSSVVPVASKTPGLRYLWRRIPLARRKAVLRYIFTAASVKPQAAPTISPALRQQLASYFAPDVARLTEIAGPVPWQDFVSGS